MRADVDNPGLESGADGRPRCAWGVSASDYVDYHDHEWGRPALETHRLFEKICLEGFQSGLSWLTILRKRDAFRAAFHDFDIARVAAMGASDVERLLGDPAIVRHRRKIESVINNAARARELLDEHGSLQAYFLLMCAPVSPDSPHSPHRPTIPATLHDVPAHTETSSRLARDLKRRGWSFVGPTTAYAFMQANGFVNDHLAGCHVRAAVEKERQKAGLVG